MEVIAPWCIPSPPLSQESCWSSCTCSQKSLIRPPQSSLTSWRGSEIPLQSFSGESPCEQRREHSSACPSTWPCPHKAPSPPASRTWQSPVSAGSSQNPVLAGSLQSPVLAKSSQSPVASHPASPGVAGSLTPAAGGALESNVIALVTSETLMSTWNSAWEESWSGETARGILLSLVPPAHGGDRRPRGQNSSYR